MAWGIRRGLSLACLYSAYVIVLAAMHRSIWFKEYDANLFEFLLLYFGAGLLGGAIVGVLRPYNGSALGGALIGALSGIPFGIGTLTLFEGSPTHWEKGLWIVLLILCFLSALVGIHFAKPK